MSVYDRTGEVFKDVFIYEDDKPRYQSNHIFGPPSDVFFETHHDDTTFGQTLIDCNPSTILKYKYTKNDLTLYIREMNSTYFWIKSTNTMSIGHLFYSFTNTDDSSKIWFYNYFKERFNQGNYILSNLAIWFNCNAEYRISKFETGVVEKYVFTPDEINALDLYTYYVSSIYPLYSSLTYIPTGWTRENLVAKYTDSLIPKMISLTFEDPTEKYYHICVQREINRRISELMGSKTKTYTNSTWSTNKTFYIKVTFSTGTNGYGYSWEGRNVVNYDTNYVTKAYYILLYTYYTITY